MTNGSLRRRQLLLPHPGDQPGHRQARASRLLRRGRGKAPGRACVPVDTARHRPVAGRPPPRLPRGPPRAARPGRQQLPRARCARETRLRPRGQCEVRLPRRQAGRAHPLHVARIAAQCLHAGGVPAFLQVSQEHRVVDMRPTRKAAGPRVAGGIRIHGSAVSLALSLVFFALLRGACRVTDIVSRTGWQGSAGDEGIKRGRRESHRHTARR